MTYKHLRKIQVYILISLSIFIFTNNIQLIFKTRNIIKPDLFKLPKAVFLKKINKTELNTNYSSILTTFKPSTGVKEDNDNKYIRAKHKQSLSRLAKPTDRLFFEIKRLINTSIYLFKKAFVSVKYRYLLGLNHLEQARQSYLESLEGLIDSRGLPLVKGMLFGDLSSVDQGTYHSFKVIGILHILSASSANFTIFLSFFLLFLKPFLKYLSKKQSFCLYFALIFIYFSLVGAAASTLRAFLSLTLAFYASFMLKRSFLPLFNLCVVAIFMLIINPFYPESLSFQFSFLASFGIIFLYNFLEKEPFINKNYLLKNISLTFSAQFFLIPILIAKFGELNYLSILANILVLPLVEILTILFLASFICLFVSNIVQLTFFEQLLSYLISKLLDILFFLINILEKSPWKSVIFRENKNRYIIVFILVNIFTILLVNFLKSKRYSKKQYRVFK